MDTFTTPILMYLYTCIGTHPLFTHLSVWLDWVLAVQTHTRCQAYCSTQLLKLLGSINNPKKLYVHVYVCYPCSGVNQLLQ